MLLNLVCGASLLLQGITAFPADQQPLLDTQVETTKKRPLYGKFLHITDFHPDSFYQVYSSTAKDAACHRGQGPAGIYGAETSECDSPIALVNKTFEWIGDNVKDEIDFVLWTGDSARHDSDEDHPRTQKEVLQLNQFMVNKMYEVFGKKNGDEDDEDPNNDFKIPIVPTFGNNDIMPHNIMVKGPNSWTRAYTTLWRQFIPEAQKHQFEQGGWFYVEVIPHQLAVFSLNTMYFFTNNAAVDGCAAHSEPGYRQMEWLRIQLSFMRQRGMKVILIGHVPPVRQEAKALFDETCWQKYALWLRQYRDIIVTSMYGHFNYDHFLLQDFEDIEQDTEDGAMKASNMNHDDDVNAQVSPSYFLQLRSEWSDLPVPPKTQEENVLSRLVSVFKKDKKKEKARKKQRKYLKKIGGKYAERFAASFVSASVVPNLYPTLRIFEYNISGIHEISSAPIPVQNLDVEITDVDASKKKKNKKWKFTVPDGPSKSAPPGPAYSPQAFSLVKYTQYLANLTHINNDFTESDVDSSKWREGKHKGKKPHDKDHKPNPKKFKFEPQYDTQDDEVYHLKDLTMPNLVDLARRIGQFAPEASLDDEIELEKKHKKKKKHGKHGKHGKKHAERNRPWFTFISRAFVETMDESEIDDQFGH